MPLARLPRSRLGGRPDELSGFLLLARLEYACSGYYSHTAHALTYCLNRLCLFPCRLGCRSGLSSALGGRIGVVTASNSATIKLWPVAELRRLAEDGSVDVQGAMAEPAQARGGEGAVRPLSDPCGHWWHLQAAAHC